MDTGDLIDRQAAIDALDKRFDSIPMEQTSEILMLRKDLRELPHANNSEIPNSSDTISRAKAIEALHTWFRNGFDEDRWWNSTHVLAVIEGLPPAQPERIRGRWIEIALSNHTYKCSVCGRLLVNITDGKNTVAKNYPYCHCGADMRGEQDERDS